MLLRLTFAILLLSLRVLSDEAPKADKDKTKAELIAELQTARAREKRVADAFEQTLQKLGGVDRLGVKPKKLREAKPEDVTRLMRALEKTGGPDIAANENLRVQIKTVEEQLAKARDELEKGKKANAGIQAIRAREKRLADAIEEMAKRLGGNERLEVEPKKLREAKPEDVKKLMRGVNVYMDPPAEIDNLRAQIKAAEGHVTKAMDALDEEKAKNAKLQQELKKLEGAPK